MMKIEWIKKSATRYESPDGRFAVIRVPNGFQSYDGDKLTGTRDYQRQARAICELTAAAEAVVTARRDAEDRKGLLVSMLHDRIDFLHDRIDFLWRLAADPRHATDPHRRLLGVAERWLAEVTK